MTPATATKEFQQTAQRQGPALFDFEREMAQVMQKPLAQEFNETAAAAHEAFPRDLERLVVLLVPDSDTPVYVSPQIADELTKSSDAVKAAVESIARRMRKRGVAGLANRRYNLAGTDVKLIAMSKNPTGIFSERFTKEMRLMFTLDHEIGHHILKNGSRYRGVSAQQAERACDAFAMLRHIQRFGKNTDYAGGCAQERAANIVLLGNAEHYTTDAILGAIEVADEMGDDIYGLSLRETATLAEKIAAEGPLKNRTLRKIQRAFEPAAEVYKKANRWDDIPKKCIEVMRKHKNNPDVFKAGKQFLSCPDIKEDMAESAKTDPYWQEALDFIQNHEPKSRRRSSLKFMTKIFAH